MRLSRALPEPDEDAHGWRSRSACQKAAGRVWQGPIPNHTQDRVTTARPVPPETSWSEQRREPERDADERRDHDAHREHLRVWRRRGASGRGLLEVRVRAARERPGRRERRERRHARPVLRQATPTKEQPIRGRDELLEVDGFNGVGVVHVRGLCTVRAREHQASFRWLGGFLEGTPRRLELTSCNPERSMMPREAIDRELPRARRRHAGTQRARATPRHVTPGSRIAT